MEPHEVRAALAVVAHPDDVEAWCGGTAALLRAGGARVAYLLLTSGDKGSPDPLADPRRLAATREAEQLAAARLVGVEEVAFLRIPDGDVTDDRATRAAIAAHIRRVRPDVILTFDPWRPYAFHRDHRECGFAALAAALTLARRPDPAGEGDPPHAAGAAWLFHTERPTRTIDIGATFALKVAARLAHACQTGDPAGVERGFRERAAALGAPRGIALAEAFREVRFPRDDSPLARLDAGE